MKLSSKNLDRLSNIESFTTNKGIQVDVIKRGDSFIVKISRSKEFHTSFLWIYESESLQSVSTWMNRVLNKPLKYKFFESGTWLYPHNNGMGNTSGKRETYNYGETL